MGWSSAVERLAGVMNRFPWLLPVTSFAAGWLGFVMVTRGAGVAQWVALLALLGWPWLLVEPLVRRGLDGASGAPGTSS